MALSDADVQKQVMKRFSPSFTELEELRAPTIKPHHSVLVLLQHRKENVIVAQLAKCLCDQEDDIERASVC